MPRSLLRGTSLDNSERDFGNGVGAEPNHKVHFFEAMEYSGDPRPTEEGIPRWVRWDEMAGLKMMPGDRIFHEWVRNRRGRYFVGKVKHVGDKVDRIGTHVDYRDNL